METVLTMRAWLLKNEGNLPRWMVWLCGLAFVLRAGAAFLGPNHFWSYTSYFLIARNALAGEGFCLLPGSQLCAYFPPVYPFLTALAILNG